MKVGRACLAEDDLSLYIFMISAILAISESAYIPPKARRPARSYQGFAVDVELWTEPSFPFAYPPHSNSIEFNFERNAHITPDFSNGLDYPDPLLLRGLAARRAISYLYSRELFFSDIPHIRAILRNQEERTANGLAGNRLGSLRPASPFHRDKGEFQRLI